jgi:hypothetical protein
MKKRYSTATRDLPVGFDIIHYESTKRNCEKRWGKCTYSWHASRKIKRGIESLPHSQLPRCTLPVETLTNSESKQQTGTKQASTDPPEKITRREEIRNPKIPKK